ncbi:MAG: nitrate- and nitrite sensing domain-containing protein [Pseudomonadota bacterium]
MTTPKEATAKLELLGQSRIAVDSFDFTVPQMAKYYTGTIVSLLEIIEATELTSTNDTISKKVLVFISFL